MNKKQVEKMFKEVYASDLEELKNDRPGKQFLWSSYTENLYKNGEITEKQLYTWDNPNFIKR